MRICFFAVVVFFFLIAPLVAIIPISFSRSPFMLFTEGMLAWPPDPEAWSFRWYRYMVGICTDKNLTTPCSNRWMVGTVNSFFVGTISTLVATALGTLAALGLSRPHMPYKGLIMSILISPMIVPLIITAAGMFFFYAKSKSCLHIYRYNFGTRGTFNPICCNNCDRNTSWF